MIRKVKTNQEEMEIPENKMEITTREINEDLNVALLEPSEEEISLRLRVILEPCEGGIKEKL